MPIKAILFDMFDTLIMINKEHAFYSPAVKSMHSFLFRNGIQVSFPSFRDAYIRARDALYDQADLKMEEPHFNVRIQNALQILGFNVEARSSLVQGATDAFCKEFINYVTLDPQTEETLRDLHRKYLIGLVSNFAIPECVQRLLQQNDLRRHFDVIIVSAAVNKRKPNPDIYRCALEKLKVSPEETVFVGDTVDADVMGPKRVGIKTIYIDRRPQKDLENHKPDHKIVELRELPLVIQNL